MSKQSKLAAWQSPAPVVMEIETPVIKETKKVEKLTDAILAKEPEVPTMDTGFVPKEVPPVVEEPKQEIKKLKKNKVEE